MKTFKKVLTLITLCLIITMVIPAPFDGLTLTVEAHSGRTDKYGGHRDNKNVSGLGSYHYHHGYPAHLHPGGVCPYADMYSPSYSSETIDNTAVVAAPVDTQQAVAAPASDVIQPTVIITDTSCDNVAFNASYYASVHSDVYALYGDNAKALCEHFITSGIYEGRQSSAQFNISVYKNSNPDLVNVYGDNLIQYYNHFILIGFGENRVAK